MIIKFEEYSLNEKLGFPDSLDPVVKFLTDFMIDKLNWWTYRKGIANYTDDFHFDMSDVDPSIVSNKKFPLAHINLKFSIIKGTPPKTPRTSISGAAFPFKGKNDTDVDYQTTRLYRGKINMFLEFKANIVGKSIQIGKLREEAHTVIRHELQHVYEDYQKMRHGVDLMKDNAVPNFNWTLMFDLFDNYPKCIKFRRFLYLFYSISHEKEFNAFMAEFTSGKVKTIEEITAGNRAMDILKYDSFDKIYNEIMAEFKRYYPNADLESIPKFVVNTTAKGIKSLKVEIPRWLKEYDKDFRGFLYQIWKRIQLKKKKFIKKSSKIFYGRKLTEAIHPPKYPHGDPRNDLDPYGEEKWEDDPEPVRRGPEDNMDIPIVNRVMNMVVRIGMDFDRPSLSREYYLNHHNVRRIPRDNIANQDIIEIVYRYIYDDATTLEVTKEYGPLRKDIYTTKLNGEVVPLNQQQSRQFWRTCRGNY